MIQLAPAEELQRIFRQYQTIAVVGLSPKTDRPSHQVAAWLMQAGYRIIPVNPGQSEILGQTCYPNLRAIPEPVEIVDIFRRADQVEPIVRDAVAIGARVVWMQQGIVNEAAARIAEQAGLTVIMDRCMKVDYMQYGPRKTDSRGGGRPGRPA